MKMVVKKSQINHPDKGPGKEHLGKEDPGRPDEKGPDKRDRASNMEPRNDIRLKN